MSKTSQERDQTLERITQAEQEWQRKVVEPRVGRFGLERCPTQFYTPTAEPDFDFLEKVGFPGQYPFTAGNSPFERWRAFAEMGAKMGVRPEPGGGGGAGRYSGYGTAEDYRHNTLRLAGFR